MEKFGMMKGFNLLTVGYQTVVIPHRCVIKALSSEQRTLRVIGKNDQMAIISTTALNNCCWIYYFEVKLKKKHNGPLYLFFLQKDLSLKIFLSRSNFSSYLHEKPTALHLQPKIKFFHLLLRLSEQKQKKSKVFKISFFEKVGAELVPKKQKEAGSLVESTVEDDAPSLMRKAVFSKRSYLN